MGIDPEHVGNHCRSCRRSWSRCDPRDAECTRQRYAAALEMIAEGKVDEGGNRHNHPHAWQLAREALKID